MKETVSVKQPAVPKEIKVGKFVIELPEGIRIRWCAVCYLIPFYVKIKDFVTLPPERVQEFSNFVLKEVYALMYENKLPNPEIAPAIMNIAEDLQSLDAVKIRGGDYVTLQNYFRKMKK